MSDSVTNVEVEDVLNSIRRLVSEEVDERRVASAVNTEKFVLTPALRVLDPQEESEGADVSDNVISVLALKNQDMVSDVQPTDPKATEHAVFLGDDAHPLHHGEHPETESEAIGDAWDQAVDFIDSTGDEYDEDASGQPDEIDQTEADADDRSDGFSFVRSQGREARQPEDTSIRDAFFSDADEMPLEDRIAELEIAVSQVADEWEPDGSEPEADQLPGQHIFATTRTEPDVLASETTEADVHEAEMPESQSTATEDRPESEEQATEMSVAFAHAPFRLHDATNLDALPAVKAGSAAQTNVPAELDEQILDEEALKELVSEIVRGELQGAMGERITRNVRRMVRREIQRAIALKDFE